MDKKAGYYIWAFNCVQDVHLINHMYGIFILAVVYKPYGIRQCMIDKVLFGKDGHLIIVTLFGEVGGCVNRFIQ